MNLARTELSEVAVTTLRGLNIRDVETLLSMTATPAGLAAIARVLNQSEHELQAVVRRLSQDHPGIPAVPVSSEIHAMGHRPTSHRRLE